MVKEVAYTGERGIDFVGALLLDPGHGRDSSSGSSSGRRAAAAVGALLAIGVIALATLGWWLVSRKRAGKPSLIDADLFRSSHFRLGITGQMMQQIALGGLMIALPIFLQMVLEYNALQAGLSIAPLSLSMFAVAVLAGRRVGGRRPAVIVGSGFVLLALGVAPDAPIIPRTDSGLWLAIPLVIAGIGLGLLVSQLNNYHARARSPRSAISEAAGVNSAGGSFGLSFGLALAGAVDARRRSPCRFTNLTNASDGAPAGAQGAGRDRPERRRRADEQHAPRGADLSGQPEEISRRSSGSTPEARPLALQVALLVPLLAAIVGLVVSFRLVKAAGHQAVSVALEGLAFD